MQDVGPEPLAVIDGRSTACGERPAGRSALPACRDSRCPVASRASLDARCTTRPDGFIHDSPLVNASADSRSGRASLRSFVLFGLVGAVGTACQYVVLIVLVRFAGIDAVIASTLGAIVGAIVNFLLNHRFTFQAEAPMQETGPRYAVLVLVAFANNALLIWLMVSQLRWNYLVAQVVATIVVFFVNYLIGSLWVFGDRRVAR